MNKESGKEHVSFGNFVRHFDLTDRDSATKAYTALIDSPLLRSERRNKLQSAFRDFLDNHAERFWAELESQVCSEITAKQAGATAQKVGVKQAEISYTKYFANVDESVRASVTLSPDDVVYDIIANADQANEQQATSTTAYLKRDVDGDVTFAMVIDLAVEDVEAEITDEAITGALPSATLSSRTTSSTSPTAPALSSSQKCRKSFTKKNRRSLEGRYQALGEKWILASGTIVEDVLYTAGSDEDCASFSFMLDLDDAKTKVLFSEEDWEEIISDLPPYEHYGKGAGEYLDKCMEVASREDMRKILEKRQDDPECKIIYYCMDQWNQDIGTVDRKKIGVKADFLWRTISSPGIDWSVGESATVWDPASMKYRNEGVFKLPRQLHDILVARTSEAGGVDSLRKDVHAELEEVPEQGE
ncbi:hypothetical protein KI688_007303 [Linnemannia hyalina]|uniref:Uncharacterized protein n=1 Tax=Linnemannia hyalina TaxID=64524 RepID=A0A9P7XHB2_9FUNG|nr:hypothetical protein KI688_007303 [Linnemannia hyalina]